MVFGKLPESSDVGALQKIFRKYSGEKILVNLITIINRHVPAAIDGFLHENPVAGFGALIPVRGDDLPQVVRRRLSLFCVSVLN